MVITDQTLTPNAFDLREAFRRSGATIYVHRANGDHPDVADASCWCCPLELTSDHMQSLSLIELQRLLAEHFAIQ